MGVLRLRQWRNEIKWTKYIIVCQCRSNCQPVILLLWQIALWPITYTVKVLVANMFVAKLFMTKLPNTKNLNPCIVAGFLASQSRQWKQVKSSNRGIFSDIRCFYDFFKWLLAIVIYF